VATTEIADNAVTTAKIYDGAVTLAKHADNSVNSAKVVDGSIGTVDLNFTPPTRPLSPGVSTVEILDGAVTTPKIADNNVTSAKIADGTIASIDIAENAVTTGKISDGAVTNAKINANAVTSDKIQNYTIKTEDIHSSCRVPNTDSLCGFPASLSTRPRNIVPLDNNGALTLNYTSEDNCSKNLLAAIALTVVGVGATYGIDALITELSGIGVRGSGGYIGVKGENRGASNTFGVFGNATGSNSIGVFGATTDDDWGGVHGGSSHSNGIGVIGKGNNLTSWIVPTTGCGVAGTGTKMGVFGGATNTSGDRGGGYFYESGGQYAYVAYTTSGGTRYKVLGGPSSTVSTFMQTQRGNKILYCPEMPEPYFEDVGEGQLTNGHYRVNLDPTFIDCITVSDKYPLKVFVQVEDDCNGVYVKKDKNGFDVFELQSGRSNVNFSYRVLGKWKGYEHLRFEDAPQPLQTVKTIDKEAKEILPETNK
jgi:hypothetical protein